MIASFQTENKQHLPYISDAERLHCSDLHLVSVINRLIFRISCERVRLCKVTIAALYDFVRTKFKMD